MLNVEQLKFILEQLQEEYDAYPDYIYCTISDIIRDSEFDIPCLNCKFCIERDDSSTCCSYPSTRKGFI